MQTTFMPGRFVMVRICQMLSFLAGFLTLIHAEAAEPEYKGKTATYWIKAYTMGMTEEDYKLSGGRPDWDGNRLVREKKTREQANAAFEEMGAAAVPYVVSWIKSADALANRFGKQKSERLGETKKPLPSWVTADEVEWRGLEALKVFGPRAKDAMPVIMEFTNHKSNFTAGMACEALGSLQKEGEPALALLTFKLLDKDASIRTLAASAIGGILLYCPDRGRQQGVFQQLILSLKDDARSVRWNSASALGHFSSDGKEAVPALMESLKAGNDRAASALGEIGPAAKAAVPLLTEVAVGKDSYVRDLAIDALKRINLAGLKGKPANIYDESADGEKQISEALVIAKREGKQVLLQFGANWCGWCHRLHQLFKSDTSIAEKLKSDYVVVLIDVNEEHNKDIDARYGHPIQHGLPVMVILDADGKQLTTQASGKLESGDHHDPNKVKAFLEQWSPKR